MPGFLMLAALSVPPFLYAVYLSFVNIDIALPNQPLRFVWLANYARVLGSDNGFHALLVTLLVSFGSTFACIAVGLLIAYLIHLFAGRLSGVVTVLVLIPLAVSPVAMALVFSLMLDPLYGPVPQVIQMVTGALISPTGTAAGALITIMFVQTWQWSPLAVILLLGGLKSLPVEPVEAAKIDGASFWDTVIHIHLPLLRPLLAVAAIFEFILCSHRRPVAVHLQDRHFRKLAGFGGRGGGRHHADPRPGEHGGLAEDREVGHAGVPMSAAVLTGSDAGRRLARARRRRAGLGRIFGGLALALFLGVWMAPLYWLVNTTFKYKVQIQSELPVWFPNPITTENIEWVWENLDYPALWRSVHVVLVSLAFSIVFGPLMAYALTRFRTRANAQLESWIISTRMMPPAALIMPFYFLFKETHLLNTEIGLALLYIAIDLPLTCWIMLAYLRSLPEDAEEAARIDGCSRWGAFWHVVLPLTRSSIAAAGLLVTILTWNEFFIAFIVTSSNSTFPVNVASFLANGMNPEYGHMAAAGLLLSLPTVLIAIVFHRSLLSGLHAFAGGK
jgi:multiple sugar transport system permease protein